MPNLAMLKIVVRETLSRRRIERMPEPSLVMDDEDQVRSYVAAGRETGVMAPTYLFHGANIADVIKPGDRVLDLACGPANQLALVARLNPEVSFVGIDLSPSMLAQAEALIKVQGLSNVSFQEGDITRLSAFADHSFDAVVSTLSLHHLPTLKMLHQTFAEAARVLRPNGGVYIMDFSRLKLRSSIEYFAYQYVDRQPVLFTQDYLNSLLAAFTLDDLRATGAPLMEHATLCSTWAVPFMASFKSPVRQPANPQLHGRFKELAAALPAWHQADLADMIRFFGLGGLRSALLA
jgi:SAM-dependent methyltransferase